MTNYSGRELQDMVDRAYAREGMLVGLMAAALSGAVMGFILGYLARDWLS